MRDVRVEQRKSAMRTVRGKGTMVFIYRQTNLLLVRRGQPQSMSILLVHMQSMCGSTHLSIYDPPGSTMLKGYLSYIQQHQIVLQRNRG